MSGSGEGKKRGAEAFRERYRALYGERWDELERALAAPADSVEYRAGGESYYLDSASVAAASALVLPEAGEVLDLCAAPGGKSVVIASRMGGGCRLVANELSSERRRRLSEALDRSLPPELRARVAVSGEEGGAMCRRNAGRFGAILLDAPCSSERHVLADPRALEAWSPSRIKSLAFRQWALLSSAFLMLAPGGCLVYATCSLAPEENELVVARLASKAGSSARFDPPEEPRAESLGRGIAFLPDRAGGAGPLYVCRLFKEA